LASSRLYLIKKWEEDLLIMISLASGPFT